MKKVLIVGNSKDNTCLEASYKRAFQELKFEVCIFDPYQEEKKYIKLGQFGGKLHTFLPVEEWRKKMNREFVIYTKELCPDLILNVCNAPITFNSLAFLKSVLKCPIVLLWPDTLFNLQTQVLSSALLYDGVATYSYASIPVFEALGFKNIHWIPLAADPYLHKQDCLAENYLNDVCFIGGCRPERVKALESIKKNFPNKKLEIYGTNWKKSDNKLLADSIIEKPLRGKEFSSMLNKSRISINIIDDTNFPAANMRFFETPIANALQLSSSCPEMNSQFIDMEHIAYFDSDQEMVDKIDLLLSNTKLCNTIIQNAYQLTIEKHTYSNRVEQVIEIFINR
jgi:glycosyltransferase involved in cell wall biosynthesis